MYVPNRYQIKDLATMIPFMRAYSFASVVSAHRGQPEASHLPLVVEEREGTVWLRGHFARANGQWHDLNGGEVMIIFGGPHAYVTPTLYDKWESVPTWNYLAVHAYGKIRVLDSTGERAELLELIAELIAHNEPSYQAQWDELPDRFRDGMLQGIVGFEVEVTRLEGSAKLSQNKSMPEQWRIGESLAASERDEVAETGRIMLDKLQQAGH